MRRWGFVLTCVLALASLTGVAAAAEAIRVGVIGPFSGPFGLYGRNFKLGIEAFVAEAGPSAGGHRVEFIYRDLEAPDPARARALAQELVVKDKVQYLAGIYFTPDALAVAPILEDAQTVLVVFNAATSAITAKSPNIVRSSFTMWQNTVPAAKLALARGNRRVAIAVSDFGPGIDAQAAFKSTFEAGGGTIVDAIRMPVATADFAPIMQRIKDAKVDAVFAFLPSGPPTLGFVKAFIDTGLKATGVSLITTGDVTPEPDLQVLGEGAQGILSTYHYARSHASPENERFLQGIEQVGGKRADVVMSAVAAFDGTRLIYKMIEATRGERNPAQALAAVKGYAWTSPRGPVSIDPLTRHIRQTIYLRRVERQDGEWINRELEAFPDQPDSGFVSPN
jgi:branched-chain amino acid transport system substrate-binding protein